MLNRLRRSPYDFRPLRRSTARPDPLVHSRAAARPVLAAYTAVYTDDDVVLDLPAGLDPDLRDLFGTTSVLDGDFTKTLRAARDHPSTERLQHIWGDALGRLAARDAGVWAELRASRARRPWLHTEGRLLRFGDRLHRVLTQDLGTVVDIEPGVAALGVLASGHSFRYWVVTRHAFIAQMVWSYGGGGRPARSFRCLRGCPGDVLRDLTVRERRTADLVIWHRATERDLAATLRQAWTLLRPQGVLLLGLPRDLPLPARETEGFDISAAGPYLWLTRTT